MGWVARAELAAAVSEAGGLGVIGAGTDMAADELRRQIVATRELTDKPFGVDILFATVRATGSEAARYTDAVQEMVQVVLEERVPVLISGLGSPAAAVPEAHARGIFVMSVVGAVRHAQKAVAGGVDAVIASGSDGGGHVGTIGTAVLIPAVADAVDVPVLAGGGLADGRALVAALALGAQGVWMGTRFVASEEAHAHGNYKGKIVATSEAGTVVTRAHSGKPCRMIRNEFTDSWEARQDEIEPYPLQALARRARRLRARPPPRRHRPRRAAGRAEHRPDSRGQACRTGGARRDRRGRRRPGPPRSGKQARDARNAGDHRNRRTGLARRSHGSQVSSNPS